MKVLVAVKRVVDYNVKVRPNDANTDVDLNNVKMAINPFCEIAVEEAIRLKEAGHADEIVVVSIGESKAEEQIRAALALGADRGLLIEAEAKLSSLNVAKVLAKVAQDENCDLVLMGKQAIDTDNNQTPQMLAALLDWPQATYASKVSVQDGALEVDREVDGGSETVLVNLPAVVSTDLRLNEPRYAKLPDIMKAKKKPLDKRAIADFVAVSASKQSLLAVNAPSTRQAGIKVANVDELIDKLKNEARVIE